MPAPLHAQRGQAVFETALFLPMFLLGLFGVIWAVQASVQSERVQIALRYAWTVSQRTGPYTNYSTNAMYRQVDLATQTLPTVACTTPITALLSDGTPYSSSQTVTLSQAFWTPLSPTQSCLFTGYLSYQPGDGDDVILAVQEPTISAPVPVPATLRSVIGTTSSASMSEFFYKQIGVDVALACFPALESMIAVDLNYVYPDTYSSATPTFPSYASDFATHSALSENTSDYFPLSANCY